MSVWTHVNGSIRIDGIPRVMPNRFSVFKVLAILGPMWLPYHDVLDKPGVDKNVGLISMESEDCRLPYGSEGSIQYRIIEYDTGLPWITIPIWGDLRDVSESQGIIGWFTFICAKLLEEKFSIRDAVLSVEIEEREKFILIHKTDEDGKCIIKPLIVE